MKNFSLIILLAVLLSSCASDSRTYIDYSVQNNSSTPITIFGSEIIHAKTLNQNVNPGEKVEITDWVRMGRSVQVFEPSLIFSQDVFVLNEIGDTLRKEFLREQNWDQDLSASREGAVHKYLFEISDEDF